MRFLPDEAARSSTSYVAIMVVAIPVTGVSGSPALKVSTVWSRHGTPTWPLMRSTIWRAVTTLDFCWPLVMASDAIKMQNVRTVVMLFLWVGPNDILHAVGGKNRRREES